MSSSLFQPQALAKAEEDFSKLAIVPEQATIVGGVAQILGQFVEVKNIILKGFIWKAIKDWQEANNRKAEELATSSPEDRVESVGYMFSQVGFYLKKILMYKTDESKIDDAIEKGFDYYKQAFANR